MGKPRTTDKKKWIERYAMRLLELHDMLTDEAFERADKSWDDMSNDERNYVDAATCAEDENP